MPAHTMTLEQRQSLYDTFRTTLSGGRIELMPAVQDLDARIRGRLIYRITISDHFHKESDHSNGRFVFAGFQVFWEIHDEQNGLCMLIGIQEA